MDILVRGATKEDLPSIMRLMGVLNQTEPMAATNPLCEAIFDEIAASRGGRLLVATADHGVVMGTAYAIVAPNLSHGCRRFMVIENVVVAPEWRRVGVGRALIDACLGIARDSACYKAQLLSGLDRGAAHEMYERCGFSWTARGYRLYFADEEG
ncbi:MAG: GNAT family N-acetyltransferase [Frankiaceae bacterium]|jgi:GNAT superfamily N-acetyltransferase|nr:GNAT family N-acetyltransferase [Frankiaceae bacterium]